MYEQSEVEAAREKFVKVFSTTEMSKNRELTPELYSAAVEAYRDGLEVTEIRRIIKEQGWKDPGNKKFNDQTLRQP